MTENIDLKTEQYLYEIVQLENAKNAGRKIIKNANSNTKFAIIANHSQMSQQWLDSRAALNLISEIQMTTLVTQ